MSDIDRLGSQLKFINIIVMPALFALVALLFAAMRRHRPAVPAPGSPAAGEKHKKDKLS